MHVDFSFPHVVLPKIIPTPLVIRIRIIHFVFPDYYIVAVSFHVEVVIVGYLMVI
jgi:hypothetical protein